MQPIRLIAFVATLGVSLVAAASTSPARLPELSRPEPSPSAPAPLTTARPPARLPVVFEANRGQTDGSVAFLARAPGYTAFLRSTDTVFRAATGDVVRMRFAGGAGGVLSGEEPTGGVTHSLIGKDETRWVRGAPQFGAARARDVYPGVDVRWRTHERSQLAYDLHVAPGADVGAIAIDFDGRVVELDEAGRLNVATEGGTFVHAAPVAFQMRDGERVPVAARFTAHDGRVGFRVGAYDPALPLVIDPSITFSTRFGAGGGQEASVAVTIAANGEIVVAGQAGSADFPTVDPIQPFGGAKDGFVARFTADGTTLLYSTFVGGTRNDYVDDVLVDGTGAVYAAGDTESLDFPGTSGSAQPDHAPGLAIDSFAFKLSADGTALVYATYLGGSAFENAEAIALDGTELIIGGTTQSSTFPRVNSVHPFRGGFEGYVTRLSADGSSFLFSTLITTTGLENIYAVAVDQGEIVFGGITNSTALGTVSPFQATHGGGQYDGMVGRIDTNDALVYLTYLGGTGDDQVDDIEIDGSREVWMTGSAHDAFPQVDATQAAIGGDRDAFLTRMAQDGQSLLFSTYLGGSDEERNIDLAHAGDFVWVTGRTGSPDFPLLAQTHSHDGAASVFDSFVTQYDVSGATPQVVFSSFFNGTANPIAYQVATTPDGTQAVICGQVFAGNMTQIGPQHVGPNPNAGGFVARFGDAPPGLGDGELYVQKGVFRVNFSKTDKDVFVIKGCLNRRGIADDLAGATVGLTVNGEQILAPVTLDSRGRAKGPDHTVSIKRANGRFSVSVNSLDLRNTPDLGVANATGVEAVAIDVRLDVAGAGLADPTLIGTLEFSARTRQDKVSRGSFSFKRSRTLSGACKSTRTSVSERGGEHSVSLRMAAAAYGGVDIPFPTGATRITIGGAAPLVMPIESVSTKGNGVSWSYDKSGQAVPGLRRLSYSNKTRTLVIQTEGLAGTGVPAAGGSAATAHDLEIIVEITAAAATHVFRTKLGLTRPSGASARWK